MYILGFDIGGTKCAVITAEYDSENIAILNKQKCSTDLTVTPEEMIDRLILMADGILDRKPDAIGISCGGPLDSKKGVIMSPPNLPLWDNVEIVKMLEKHYGVTALLQNDANACALAEWKFGAGKGSDNVVFLTFGTGLGAGLILGGRLYEGANGNAGEAGHIRLSKKGPIGYGKEGSFEGFCSGGGLKQLSKSVAEEYIRKGVVPSWYDNCDIAEIARCAREGDEAAREVFDLCGEKLGQGLSVIIDLLNPDKIIIGSIYARCCDLLKNPMKKAIEREALYPSLSVCEILPAELGEGIGDMAAIATALQFK